MQPTERPSQIDYSSQEVKIEHPSHYGLDMRSSREQAAAADVVIMDKKRCGWAKKVSTVSSVGESRCG